MDTNKQWIRKPFDIELAKKIQSGEVEGRIVTVDGTSRSLFFLGNNNVMLDNFQFFCSDDGVLNGIIKLFIELPEETPKHEFKPFDKVLVRDSIDELWRPQLYDRFTKPFGLDENTHLCLDGEFHYYCIPYEGNEHLVGTTDKPK